MGAANAIAAFRYAGKVPPLSLVVLIYMGLVSVDKHDEPWFGLGPEAIAVHALRRPEPVTASDLRAVERTLTPLFKAGAITTVRRGWGRGGDVRNVRYRLWLIEPAPDEMRRVQRSSTRRFVVEHPTVCGNAPDGKRRAPYEEDRGGQRSKDTPPAVTTPGGSQPIAATNGHTPNPSTVANEIERARQARARRQADRARAARVQADPFFSDPMTGTYG